MALKESKFDLITLVCLFLIYVLFMVGCGAKGVCTSGDCLNGTGNFKFETGEIYVGDFVNGKPVGSGELLYPDGKKYTGELVENLAHGTGELLRLDGSKYVGIFIDGKFAGPGKLVFADGQELQCQMIDGVFVGQPQNETEEVYVADEGVTGKGTDEEATREIVGEDSLAEDVVEDVIEEVADDTLASQIVETDTQTPGAGTCISGDCVNGRGGFIYTNENFYSGFFVNGKPEGQGELSKNDGEFYAGEFKGGLYDGPGKLERPDGSILEGIFVEGSLGGAAQ